MPPFGLSKTLALAMLLGLLILPSYAHAATDYQLTVKVTVQRFYANSVHINVLFSVDGHREDMNLSVVFTTPPQPNTVGEGIVASTLNREYRSAINVTEFVFESDLPLKSNNRSIPFDNYTLTLYFGTNYFIREDLQLFYFPTLPTANYIGYWWLDYLGNWSDLQRNLPFPMLGTNQTQFGNYWLKFRLFLLHSDEWTMYAKTMMIDVPNLFAYPLLATLSLVPVTIIADLFQKRYRTGRWSRTSSYARLLENVLLPAAATVIVFIPIYWYALRDLKSPLTWAEIDIRLYQLTVEYVGLVILATIMRVIIKDTGFFRKS